MTWRTKEDIMRWHTYQSLVARARRKRRGSARPPDAPNYSIYGYEQEHGHEQEL